MANSEDQFMFIVDWFDQQASLNRKYQLTYYYADSTIEMYDIKNHRTFLKRCQYPSLSLNDLFIGATVTIYARQLKVVEYAGLFTRSYFDSQKGKTFAMIKPDCYTHIGKIIDTITQSGLTINAMKMVRFTLNDAVELYSEHQGKPFFDELVNFISSDVIVGMELISENVVAIWRELIGPTNPNTARIDAPRSLRAIFGTDEIHNAVHGSDTPSSAIKEIDYFFSLKGSTAVLNGCACCIIKPHALNNAGKIIDIILSEGFEISALQMFKLDKTTIEEFLEVYKDFLPEYGALVDEFISGPCIAMEIRQENVVESFKELCGPTDPEIAKQLRPNSIRAKFGINKVQNAVHCTDLLEDGILECEYFFKIITKST